MSPSMSVIRKELLPIGSSPLFDVGAADCAACVVGDGFVPGAESAGVVAATGVSAPPLVAWTPTLAAILKIDSEKFCELCGFSTPSPSCALAGIVAVTSP